MTKNIRKEIIDLFILLPKLSKKSRNSILSENVLGIVNSICEVCLNLLKSNIPLTKSQKQKLSHFKQRIRLLARKKLSLKKRKYTLQRGGSFLPLLLSIVAPFISKLVTG